MALDGARRPHASVLGTELGLDAECHIPFGTEPEANRKYRIQQNSMDVSCDFVLRHSFEMRKIIAGGLVFSGDIDQVRIGEIQKDSADMPHLRGISFEDCENGAALYDSPLVPLTVEVTSHDGSKISFRTGEDYWRWVHAADLDGVSQYRIVREKDTVVFSWGLYEFHPASAGALPPAGRNWRLNWNLRWKAGREKAAAETAKYKDILDLSALEWKKDACVVNADGSAADVPCCCASPVLNVMKKWLRGHLADIREGDVLAVKACPHVCRSSAHMNRGKFKTLLHRDDMALCEFQRWANRQLNVKNAELEIIR